MKMIFQTANVRSEAIAFRQAMPFWFAVFSPFIGVLMGLLGAWLFTWFNM